MDNGVIMSIHVHILSKGLFNINTKQGHSANTHCHFRLKTVNNCLNVNRLNCRYSEADVKYIKALRAGAF